MDTLELRIDPDIPNRRRTEQLVITGTARAMPRVAWVFMRAKGRA